MAINPQMEINPVDQARVNLGISVDDLARRAGIDVETLRNGLQNPADMTLSELTAVARELGADPLGLALPILAAAA